MNRAKNQETLKVIKDAVLLFRLSEIEKKEIEDYVNTLNQKLPKIEVETELKK